VHQGATCVAYAVLLDGAQIPSLQTCLANFNYITQQTEEGEASQGTEFCESITHVY
jgi:hypothetical protein